MMIRHMIIMNLKQHLVQGHHHSDWQNKWLKMKGPSLKAGLKRSVTGTSSYNKWEAGLVIMNLFLILLKLKRVSTILHKRANSLTHSGFFCPFTIFSRYSLFLGWCSSSLASSSASKPGLQGSWRVKERLPLQSSHFGPKTAGTT